MTKINQVHGFDELAGYVFIRIMHPNTDDSYRTLVVNSLSNKATPRLRKKHMYLYDYLNPTSSFSYDDPNYLYIRY